MTGCNAAQPAENPMPENLPQAEEVTAADEDAVTEETSAEETTAEEQAAEKAVDPEEYKLTGIDDNTVYFIKAGSEQSSYAEKIVSDEDAKEITDMINNAPKTAGNVNGTENIWFKNGDVSVYISTGDEGYASIHGAADIYAPLDETQCERLKTIVEGIKEE